jgi:hypothetical protein
MDTGQTFVITQENSLRKLYRELSHCTDSKLQDIGKDYVWIKFATREGDRYHIHDNKEEQWELLYEIALEVSNKTSDFRLGQVVDCLSELVNTTVSDVLKIHGLRRHHMLTNEEVDYTQKQLIELVGMDEYVPEHPWHRNIKTTDTGWLVKDLTNAQEIVVETRSDDKRSVYYLKPQK